MAGSKIKPNVYLLAMSSAGGKAEDIATSTISEHELMTVINNIVKGLSVALFRGVVQFIIYKTSTSIWTTEITFTDDIPNGYWNTVHN